MFGKKEQKLTTKKGSLLFGSAGSLILILTFFQLSFYLSPIKSGLEVSHNATKEVRFWKNFLAIYPDYKAGWIRLAKLNIKEGNLEEARNALKRVENINPNDNELKKIKERLKYL